MFLVFFVDERRVCAPKFEYQNLILHDPHASFRQGLKGVQGPGPKTLKTGCSRALGTCCTINRAPGLQEYENKRQSKTACGCR